MPSNIEVKARVSNPEHLGTLAERLSDTPPEMIEQHDTFFPCVNGRLKLRQFSAQAGELIAYARADVKDPKRSDYAIVRTSTPTELPAVLSSALGVQRTVRKTRLVWRVGQARIHLAPFGGLAPSSKSKSYSGTVMCRRRAIGSHAN
jgi:adenylate cyclase class IV